MKRDFQAELRAFAAKLDNPPPKPRYDISDPLPDAVTVPEGQDLYDVYKRSLPMGVNRPVLMGLPKDEAERQRDRLNEKERIKRNEQMLSDDRVHDVLFYDIVRQSDASQKLPFWNDGRLTEEERQWIG